MPDPLGNTIDSHLLSERFEEFHFAPEQRSLMRAFFRHPASAWAKPNVHLPRGDATGSKRWRENQTSLGQHSRPSSSFSASTKRPKPSHTSTITIPPSPPPSTSASAPPPPGTSHHSSVSSSSIPAAAATASPKSHRPCRIETLASHTPSQGLQAPKALIREEDLVTSYSPIDDIDGFIRDLQNSQVQENQFAFPRDTSHADTVFCLYVNAKSQERLSNAIAKIAAYVLVSLYPTEQLTATAVGVCKKHSGSSETEIRSLFRDCKKLGRACHHVRKVLGPSAIFLLDGFSACGTKQLSFEDEAVLVRCREVLASTTDFAQQQARLQEPMDKLLSAMTSGAAWRPGVHNVWTASLPHGAIHDVAVSGQQVARPSNPSVVPVVNLGYCRDVPCWQSNAILATTAATKDKQIALDRPASVLLILWCFHGDRPISIEALRKGGKTQPRWTPDGQLGVLTPEQVGISGIVASFLTNTDQVNAAVQTLLKFGLLERAATLYDGSSTYTIDADMKKSIIGFMSPEARAVWTTQVLMLVAYTFPRPDICEDFRERGRHLLPHFQHSLQQALSLETSIDNENDSVLSLAARTDLCLALLAASELPGKWKDEALRQVQYYAQATDDTFIEMSTAYRESTRSRVKGDTPKSRMILQTARGRFASVTQISHSLRAVSGLLNVSEALNFVQDEDLTNAVAQLSSWSPMDPNEPSTMERVVLVKTKAQLAKVLRYQGRFDEALTCLESIYEVTMTESLFEDVRVDIANEMGAVLTEKGRPEKAQTILRMAIEHQNLKGRRNTAASQLLQISLAETLLRQDQIDAANDCYKRLSNLAPFANLCYHVGLARVAHSRLDWSLALAHWTDALKVLAKNFPRGDSHSGHTSLGILRSMHVALNRSGYDEIGNRTKSQILDIEATCDQHGCKHWVPGLNSYWMEFIRGYSIRRTASL